MKKIKKTLCIVMTALILLSSFSGCGVIKGDTVMSLGDYKITEAMYSYWMARYKTLFLYAYNNSRDAETFWKTEISEGYNYEEFIVEYINNYAKKVLVSMKLFDDFGLVFSDTTKKNVKDQMASLTDVFGSKKDLNTYLAEYGLNAATLERIYYAEQKYTAVIEYLYGPSGAEKVTDTERENYYKANYFCADWIYVYTSVKLKQDEEGSYYTDENGMYLTEELTEEEKKVKKEKVSSILTRLENGENFSVLKAELSEEDQTKYAFYPDGIYLSANDYENYGTDFIKAVKDTEIGEITCFEDEYATFIIKRNELKEYSALSTQELNIMNNFESYVLDKKTEDYFGTFEVEYNDEVMSGFDIKTLKGLTNTNV